MANKISGFKVRAESHQALDQILKEGDFPLAECREFPGQEEPYQVWDGPEIREVAPAPDRAEISLEGVNIRFTPDEMDDLATRIAKKLKGEG